MGPIILPFLICLLFFPAQAADACSACSMSIVNALFPFMWEATWVLAVWRIIYVYFQLDAIKKRPLFFLGRELVILGFLYLTFWWACFFLYLIGVFGVNLYRSLRNVQLLKRHKQPRVALATQAVAALAIVPTAMSGYSTYATQDHLDRLRLYVYPGTSQSRALAKVIAQDPSLDLRRIREMLESPDDHNSCKAVEVLRMRESPKDLLTLQDIILAIPEEEYSWDTARSPRTSVYLPLWLEAVTGDEVETREELRAWIAEAEMESASKESTSSAMPLPQGDNELEGMEVFLLEPGRDCYFSKNLFTSMDYLHFRKDGTYREIDIGDIGVGSGDKGKWRQGSDGKVALESTERFRWVVAGPLSVWINRQEDVDELADLKEDILKFLNDSEDAQFSPKTIEKIGNRSYGMGTTLTAINVGSRGDLPVSREDLNQLVEAIDEYPGEEGDHVLHVTPVRVQGSVALVWKDRGTSVNRDPRRIKEWLERDRAGHPLSIYVKSDRQAFLSDLNHYKLSYLWEIVFGG